MTDDKKTYEILFGDIPEDDEGRLTYILGKKIGNSKFKSEIDKIIKKFKKYKKKKIEFTWYKVLKPSARPRANMRSGLMHMYVPRAADNGKQFSEFCKENNLPIIDTPCTLNIKIYQKTPSSFSIKNKLLAEMGLIRPWGRTGDFDNYAKAVADAIQHGMLVDDCLITSSQIDKFYSIKPRVFVQIEYYEKFPEY